MALSLNGTSGISGVDGSAGTPALQGSDTNTGISFGTDEVNINTGGTTRATVDSSGRVLVGTSSSFASCQLEINAAAQSIAARSNNDAADFTRYQAGSNGSFIFLRKSRNATLGSHTIVNNGDGLGGIEFSGSDGTNFITAARIAAEVDGTPGANDMPGRLVFSTTADGASSPTERMRIGADGTITTPQTYNRPNASHPYIRIDSAGNHYRDSSSAKYKQDIETLEDQYANNFIQNVRPVWFRSSVTTEHPEYGWYGFIAEELAQIDKRLVFFKDEEDGSQSAEGVHYEKVTPLLVNLIQRQQKAIETLEAKVAALESA